MIATTKVEIGWNPSVNTESILECIQIRRFLARLKTDLNVPAYLTKRKLKKAINKTLPIRVTRKVYKVDKHHFLIHLGPVL